MNCFVLNNYVYLCKSCIVCLCSFQTFSLFSEIEGRPLTPSDVFTGLALFNQLTVPLYIIPFVIPMMINAVVKKLCSHSKIVLIYLFIHFCVAAIVAHAVFNVIKPNERLLLKTALKCLTVLPL